VTAFVRCSTRTISGFFFLSAIVLCLLLSPAGAQKRESQNSIEVVGPPHFGLYAKALNCDGIFIRGTSSVRDELMLRACDMANAMLAKQNVSRLNMMQKGVELHINPQGEESRLNAVGADDETKRRIELQQLLTNPYRSCFDGDSCTRQLALAVMSFGFDGAMRKHIEEQFREAKIRGLWSGTIAGSSPQEYWSQLSMLYFRQMLDPVHLAASASSHTKFSTRDSGGYTLVDRIYGGSERPAAVEAIRARSVSKLALSKVNNVPAQLQLVNNSTHSMRILWMDSEGHLQSMGELSPFSRILKDTTLSQVWVVENQQGTEIDRFIIEDSLNEYIVAD
jgi:hypothetical protein